MLLTSITTNAQNIPGAWSGELKVQASQLKIIFHIKESEKGFSATMDSPDQKAFGIPVTQITFENSKLHIEMSIGIVYDGELQDDTIKGIFKQNGMSFPLNLKRDTARQIVMLRPQEPKEPFPYLSEDVTFENEKDNISLSGTLTLPKKEGVFPVVVLIAGSGPEDRNEEVFGHKPFLVLSDYLTRNGIAVLRYDKRGIGKSTGNYQTATTADFASDAESAIKYLQTRKEINKKEIGLIGHSEGGIIAPLVASENKSVAFIVMLAGPGLRGNQLMLLQKENLEREMGIDEKDVLKGQDIFKGAYQIILHSEPTDINLKNKINAYLTEKYGVNATKEEINSITNQIVTPWFIYFLKNNPSTYLEKVKCPVLALNGSKDLQVPPEQNIIAIKQAFADGGNKKVTTEILPGLNHLFQECKTGLPNEYATIEQTFSPQALLIIKDWIIKQTKQITNGW